MRRPRWWTYGPDCQSPGAEENYCSVVEQWKQEYHGTYLAGIVASANNGPGSHFIGLAPNVPIVPISWDDNRTDAVRQRVEKIRIGIKQNFTKC